ncbi:MAG: hypothetical protein DMG64_17555 [Acidobacteria bacterium]|nr:MAG: hypothetical protein DMG64_17555 [Acidobacteriota bacterium]
MAEHVLDQIVADLRQRATTLYPNRGELRNIRIVGHTPKSDHFIYDLVADFANGAERMALKVYRSGKNLPQAARNHAGGSEREDPGRTAAIDDDEGRPPPRL